MVAIGYSKDASHYSDENPWLTHEVEGYKQLEDPKLTVLYEKYGITNKTPPQIRAEFLMRDVLDELDAIQLDAIYRVAATKGRHHALNLLEKMAISQISFHERRANG
ncbi:hypothetical protein J4216_00025 [Candidatus Woesearchaeota archaeon]|nr:hypothetical protein [Candidatus Woesearchaeota archaeon]